MSLRGVDLCRSDRPCQAIGLTDRFAAVWNPPRRRVRPQVHLARSSWTCLGITSRVRICRKRGPASVDASRVVATLAYRVAEIVCRGLITTIDDEVDRI